MRPRSVIFQCSVLFWTEDCREFIYPCACSFARDEDQELVLFLTSWKDAFAFLRLTNKQGGDCRADDRIVFVVPSSSSSHQSCRQGTSSSTLQNAADGRQR